MDGKGTETLYLHDTCTKDVPIQDTVLDIGRDDDDDDDESLKLMFARSYSY